MQAVPPSQLSEEQRKRVFYETNLRLATARGDKAKADAYRRLLATS